MKVPEAYYKLRKEIEISVGMIRLTQKKLIIIAGFSYQKKYDGNP